MVPETAETTETKSTELSDEEKAAITAEIDKLTSKLGEGCGEHGPAWFNSPEAKEIMKSLEKLQKGKKLKKAADPRKAEVKEALPAILETQAARFKESLVASLVEKFPYLAELEGFTVDVKLKAKGIGRTGSGEGTTRSTKGRVLHRDAETMKRLGSDSDPRTLRPDGLPGVKKLKAAYPDQAEEIDEIFGTSEKRRALWEDINGREEYTQIVHLKLNDGSVLCLQK